MGIRRAVLFYVVEQSVGNFEDGLIGNVLVRPKPSLAHVWYRG